MKKKIIEKLELPYDDGKGNFSSGSGEIHILRKVNEIIDVLNSWVFEPTLTIPSQSQKQPENKSNVEWKDGDILTTIDQNGITHNFILNDMANLGKQESYKEKWAKHLEKINHILQLGAELGISKEIEDFVFELLKREKSILQMMSDRAFTKEELKVIKEWYDGMLYPTSPDERDKLVHDKLSKLLKEEE